MKNKITKITAREILDSRGNPTIETTVYSGEFFAVASVPSGASTGVHEALELRDGNKKRFAGLGVQKACKNVTGPIFKAVKGKFVEDIEELDRTMIALDKTANKSRLGANAILSVSLASARLAAQLSKKPLYEFLNSHYKFSGGRSRMQLPTPLLNVINGGVHADSGLDVQEFFLIPLKGTFANKIERSHAVIKQLKSILTKKHLSVGVGDEGGFAPHIGSNKKALRVLAQAIDEAGYKLKKDFALGLDAAASEFFDTQKEIYYVKADRKHYKPASIYKLYESWANTFGLQIIEDGCAEDDFLGWQKLTANLGGQLTLVGDDLFVTDTQRIEAGIIAGIANAVLIKVNQIGSLTETVAAIKLAQKYNYKVVISHRSGETMDDFIADLAVACGADYIKAGSLSRGERLAKYNRLLAIESELNFKKK
ncbi:MAG TPA: phosphopyruvate hydratase [Patescibacteria group bacterium]|jgi:enolase|nr:phosphopyruvate hydratase [Patescibacteria group bacterium]